MNTTSTPKKRHPLIIFLIEILTARAGLHFAQSNEKEKHRA
ncbi:hypothetical protein QX205_21170 [Acinetobacter pittii]|jgi:hypothetical protein|nr:hypothetical protein [Acinetobacter pittii]MDN4022545.1 hypothetical protein [Acinetobacter pittii]